MSQTVLTGGCLCGALSFEARGEPLYMGLCYCADCRKASGSGFIPFMSYAAGAVQFVGQSLEFKSKAARGGVATRNFCPACGGLVFGGERGITDSYTLYAGALDDPSAFRPTLAIFAKDRAAWAIIPPGLTVYDGLPG